MSIFEKSIYVFLISILPIIELRGAIPVGAALGLPFYIYAPLSVLGNLLPVPFILLFIPKVLDLLERVRFLRPVVQWIRRKAHKGAARILEEGSPTASEQTDTLRPADTDNAPLAPTEQIPALEGEADNTPAPPTVKQEQNTSDSSCLPNKKMSPGIFLALMFFVMIPLPGTGAWTGALVASLFDLPKRHSLLAITLGVLGAAVIMTLASEGVVSIFRLFL